MVKFRKLWVLFLLKLFLLPLSFLPTRSSATDLNQCKGLNQAREWAEGGVTSRGIPYVAGGRNENTLDTIELFSFSKMRWEIYKMRAPRLDQAMLSLNDGRIFISGGKTRSNEIFDPATQKSRIVEPLMDKRSDHKAVQISRNVVMVLGDSPYIEYFSTRTGRRLGSSPAPGRFYGKILTLVAGSKLFLTTGTAQYIYDFPSKKWSKGSPLDHERTLTSISLIPGTSKVLIAGGLSDLYGREDPTVESYDILTGEVLQHEEMPVGMQEHQSVAISKNLIIFGGASAKQEVAYFDAETYQWHRLGDLRHRRHGSWALGSKGLYFTVGGYGHDENDGYLKSVEIYDSKNKKWYFCE